MNNKKACKQIDLSDNRELFQLISSHAQYTQSPLVKRILSDWENYLKHFIQVTPIEYKKYYMKEKWKN